VVLQEFIELQKGIVNEVIVNIKYSLNNIIMVLKNIADKIDIK